MRVMFVCRLRFALMACVFVNSGAKAIDVYHVGNSLTWDSQPRTIQDFAESTGNSHEMGYHIRCSWSLTRMLTAPTSTCVSPTSFGTFEPALSENAWDAVTLQPYPSTGTTLQSEADAILSMINTTRSYRGNEDTKFYIFTGWPTRGTLIDEWGAEIVDDNSTKFELRRDAYDHVYQRVTAATDAEVYVIPVGEIIYQLATMIDGGEIDGLTRASQLYRDEFHMSHVLGRYVASATTFSTLYGDDLDGITLPGYSADIGSAVNDIIWNEVRTNAFTGVPEPGVGLSILLLAGLVARGRASRRPASL